ncbi:MAG: hypothetical protein HQ549_01405 [Candidatus Omnitrophica bacterium]|nr:hypothetical protein [Candidatus Omnitrophota bacterium]
MKKVLLSVAIIAIIIICLIVTLTHLSKHLLELVLGHELGTRVTMGKISLDTKNHVLHMKDCVVYNPEGFNRDHAVAYLPEIVVWYDVKNLIENKKIHMKELEVSMRMLNVVKDKNGRMNVSTLKISLDNLDIMPIEFDKLILTVDEVVYKDYSKGGKPRTEAYSVNIRAQSFESIPSVDDVFGKILMESLSKTAIKGMAVVGLAAVAGGVVAGPVIIPVGIAAIVLSGKDSYKVTIEETYDGAYDACMESAKEMGGDIYGDKALGVIRLRVPGANVTIKIVRQNDKETKLTVSARKLMISKPRIAAGVLCDIYQNLESPESIR